MPTPPKPTPSTGWTTSDGKFHENEDAAISHEHALALGAFLSEDGRPRWPNFNAAKDGQGYYPVIGWLRDNKHMVETLWKLTELL